MPQDFDELGSDLQDDDDGEDEEQESDQPQDEPELAAHERPANPVAEAAVGIGKPVDKKGELRVRKKKGGKGKARGLGMVDPKRPEEADLLWAWVMQDLAEKGIDPSYVTIRVARIDVGREVTCGYLQGDAVQGDEFQLPSDALVNAIVDNFHLTSAARGPVLYKIVFLVKGSINRSGQIKLPSPEEIINQRRQRQGQQWYPQGAGFGAPQPNYPPQQRRRDPREGGPQGYGGPQGFGAPQQQPTQGYQQPYDPRYPQQQQQPYDPRADRLEREMSDLKQLVREVLTTGRAPAPQQQGMTLEMLAALKTALEPLGIKLSAAAPGLGALPAAPALPALPPKQNKESQEFEEGITKKIRTHMMHQTDKVLDAIFNPSEPKKEVAKEEEEEEEKPEADFEMVEVPGNVCWPGTTTPIRYARDIETGEVDYLKSAVFGNPHAMDKYGGKVIEIVGKLADGIKSGGVGLGGAQRPPPQIREGLNGTQAAPQPAPNPPQQAVAQPAGDGEDPFGL
jgi:hypothetical protein